MAGSSSSSLFGDNNVGEPPPSSKLPRLVELKDESKIADRFASDVFPMISCWFPLLSSYPPKNNPSLNKLLASAREGPAFSCYFFTK